MKPTYKLALLAFLTGLISGPVLAVSVAQLVPGVYRSMLDAVAIRTQIRTVDYPFIFLRYDTDIFVARQCMRIDTARISEIPRVDWMPVGDFEVLLFAKIPFVQLTAAELTKCFSGMAQVPPSTPRIVQ